MKKYLLLAMMIIGACKNYPDNAETEYKNQIGKDSLELERKQKVIDFATEMAILKAQQGYDSAYVQQFRDSILSANNVQPK